MLIVCPTCATSYDLSPAALGAGRNVRCASCKNTWFASAEPEFEEATALAAPVARASAPPAEEFAGMGELAAAEVIRPASAVPDNPFAVADAPPLVPQEHAHIDEEASAPKFDPGVPDQAEPVARRLRPGPRAEKARPALLRRLVSLPMLILLMLAIVLSALNWRDRVVRHFPQTASLYAALGLPVNLRGLYFQDVKSRSELEDGASVLVIEGTIVNLTTRTLDVPRLRFALRNATGHEVYAWTAQPTKAMLGSGNGLPFRARLAAPPADSRDVIVRFLNRRDVGGS
jgi:predicted Zn finger-like uncharacterized protein